MTTVADILPLIVTSARRDAIVHSLSKSRRVRLTSLAGSSPAFALTALAQANPVLVLADSADDAGYLYHDLTRLLGDDATAYFPSAYKRDIKYGQVDPPSQILRTDVLARWHDASAPRFVVTYPEALAEQVAEASEIEAGTLHLRLGQTIGMTEAVRWLRENGFTQTDYVYEPGQMARRGSILDVYAYNNELPYRIDFFGDEIDSIRCFNVETQLSERRLEEVAIAVNASTSMRGQSLLEFVPEDTLLVVHDPEYVVSRVSAVCSETFSQSAILADEGDKDAVKHLVDAEAFARQYDTFRRVEYTAAEGTETAKSRGTSACINFDCSPQGVYHKNFDLIGESFGRFLTDGYKIYILSDSEAQFERLRQIFEDRGEKIEFEPVKGTIHEGFVDHATRRCVFTDHQIFDRFHKYTLKSDRARSGKVALSLKELQSIEPGDYIVHIDHGVGRFAGMMKTDVGGRPQEMIKLVYANDDIIFVSIHSLHKLSKYRGKEGVPPKVNKLGSGAWNKVKERAKSKLKDIARDLIKLYAERGLEKGFAFSPDGYLQQELEASFIYEDTPDQLTATEAVKADMERERPMDRLICGDVGFGKTEIAIRAAFKAAVDGKQTAVLVPTTVLAYQHYNTFARRLKDFPVRVDYLSRARTPKDVKRILADLARGEIDILIGTHKLIGKDVHFKDLGLLVVDEEQKFGVAVKERLKQMRVNVDTLTMSATPIPRTLQFSLMGARDLSAITTPPPNRYPIMTSVNTLSDEIVTEAVNFELSRGGQVFVINNRIEGLSELENMIHRLVPDARVVTAHGQMPPERLERAIIDFANHDYDVLLATTIVESGIDMPNVNTIIINNAQQFGLSELHQLRGRVGRSSRKAFCYLLVPPGRPLSAEARRRLQAIESFSDLGSGIHIAMQDLDIRGAGNLLGAEQSGFIADLGYETYQKVLREAVTELRAEEFGDVASSTAGGVQGSDEGEYVADCVIESDMELLLPADYVPGDSERIALYQELDNIERETDLLEFRTRLEDRFGRIPPQALELLRIPRLRRLARGLGIEKVSLKGGVMYVYFVDSSNRAYYESAAFGRLLAYLQANAGRCQIRERAGRRSFAISDVPTVETAVAILNEIQGMNAL